jgi:hypothetical protein
MAHDERRKEIVEEQSDDDIPIAQRKRKVGKVPQHPRGHGDTNPPPAPHHSTEQSRRARTKHAHKPDSHYDDYLDISLDTLENFILRPQKPPCAGIVRMEDYTKGSHDIYTLRYDDPAQYQKEFDIDPRF